MWVVTLEPPSVAGQGDHIYRTLEPSIAVTEGASVSSLCGTWLSPLARQAAEDADVLVLCQAIDPDFLPLMQRRRARGLTSIVEFNDHFLAAQSHNPVAAFYSNPVNRSLAFQLARQADGLQFSTQALALVFGHLNSRHQVLRNAVRDGLYQDAAMPRQAVAAGCRLGWGGSAGHRGDLQWLMPGLKRILAQAPQTTLCIMGAPALAPLFDWVAPHRLEWHDSGSLDAYQAFLQTLDVGVAPLCSTPFNNCRSDVKYIEYTMAGVAGVFADSPAYADTVEDGATGLIAATPERFAEQVLRLLQAPALRRSLVQAAQAQVTTERTRAKAGQARLNFWRSLAPGAWRPDVADAQSLQAAPAWTQRLRRQDSVAPGVFVLGMQGAQADLHDALLLGAHPDAARHLERACVTDADNYLAWLYLAHASLLPAVKHRALKRAKTLAPHSVATRLALSQYYFDVGAPSRALATLETSREPKASWEDGFGFAPLEELRGRAAQSLGNAEQAIRAYQAALRSNPWYRSCATRLAQLLIEAHRKAEAEGVLTTTMAMGSPHWLDAFLLGELARQSGAWSQAKQHFDAARRLGGPADPLGARLAQSCAALGDKAGTRRALSWARLAAQAPNANL